MEKNFNLMMNVGCCKYVVNDHDGVTTNRDGSPFYGMSIFKNKKKANQYCRELERKGYKCRGFSRF